MTTSHNIQITSSKTDLKVTYRNGKFKKLEHLRGELSQKLFNSINRAIPVDEANFNAFKIEFEGRVTYEPIIKEKSLYTQFSDEWFTFYQKLPPYVSPKFTGTDGKALKQIITYLKEVNNGSESVALANWQLLLSKWDTLIDFHQANTDLKYINSKLNVIIREITTKNSTNVGGTGRSVEL